MTPKEALFQHKHTFFNTYDGPEWMALREEIQEICSKYNSWLTRVEKLKDKIEEEKRQVNFNLTYRECLYIINILDCYKGNFDPEKVRTIIGKIQSSADFRKHGGIQS